VPETSIVGIDPAVNCKHPADQLVVLDVTVHRDIMEKPISIWSEDPTDFVLKKVIVGAVRYEVLCRCKRCDEELMIGGTIPCQST